LFVYDGRFTPEVRKSFNDAQKIFFPEGNGHLHTTIIRNRFPYFEDADACQADMAAMKAQNADNKRIFTTFKVLHVDMPPVTKHNPNAQMARASSRVLLLTWLTTRTSLFYPASKAVLFQRIDSLLEEEARPQREAEELARRVKAQAEAQAQAKAKAREVQRQNEALAKKNREAEQARIKAAAAAAAAQKEAKLAKERLLKAQEDARRAQQSRRQGRRRRK
jgi:hypothetical protein